VPDGRYQFIVAYVIAGLVFPSRHRRLSVFAAVGAIRFRLIGAIGCGQPHAQEVMRTLAGVIRRANDDKHAPFWVQVPSSWQGHGHVLQPCDAGEPGDAAWIAIPTS